MKDERERRKEGRMDELRSRWMDEWRKGERMDGQHHQMCKKDRRRIQYWLPMETWVIEVILLKIK